MKTFSSKIIGTKDGINYKAPIIINGILFFIDPLEKSGRLYKTWCDVYWWRQAMR